MELQQKSESKPIETTPDACPALKLECQACGAAYEKPESYSKWNTKRPNVFFKWSLMYCDKCRREKEAEALKGLPKVIEALSKGFQ